MLRKCVCATVSAALCTMSVWPGIAAAQEYRSTGIEAPQGVTATLNVRVPLGRERQARPSYGLTFGYGQPYSTGFDGRTTTRAVNFADFRLNDRFQLHNARLAGFDLANPDQAARRMNLVGSGKKTWLIIGAIVVAGVVICIAAECFEDDDENSDSSTSTPGN